jgi:MtN3 and saliva related transmembrane protein
METTTIKGWRNVGYVLLMETTTIIGIVAGIFTATSLLPQLIKILKEKKADDVSPWMLIILMTGVGLWVYYGIRKDDWPIIVTNSFSFFLNTAVLICKFIYTRKK